MPPPIMPQAFDPALRLGSRAAVAIVGRSTSHTPARNGACRRTARLFGHNQWRRRRIVTSTAALMTTMSASAAQKTQA
jgi:hypothetical protein